VVSGGAVECWGHNDLAQLGDGTTTDTPTPGAVWQLTNVDALAAGDTHTCARLADGSLRCWGDDGKGELGDGRDQSDFPQGEPLAVRPVVAQGLGYAEAISVGEFFSCALVQDGHVQCWGQNAAYGELGAPLAELNESLTPRTVTW
jgi:alpha-tubulin suppressor-like RCC1 family protein